MSLLTLRVLFERLRAPSQSQKGHFSRKWSSRNDTKTPGTGKILVEYSWRLVAFVKASLAFLDKNVVHTKIMSSLPGPASNWHAGAPTLSPCWQAVFVDVTTLTREQQHYCGRRWQLPEFLSQEIGQSPQTFEDGPPNLVFLPVSIRTCAKIILFLHSRVGVSSWTTSYKRLFYP